MKTIPAHQPIDIPLSVASCPYCDGCVALYAQAESWVQCDDGSWQASGVRLECTSEPPLEDGCDQVALDLWSDWVESHTYMPYVYWLPVDRKVLAWINTQYRFEFDTDPCPLPF